MGRYGGCVDGGRYLLEHLDIILHPSSQPFPPLAPFLSSPTLFFFLAFVLPSSPLLSSPLFSLHPFLLSIPPLLPPLLSSSLLQEPEIIVHTTSSTATTDHTDNTTSSSSSSSSSSAPPAGSHYLSSQLLSEKTKLARKIREYNRKTTPVNHIHIKSASSSVSGGRGRRGERERGMEGERVLVAQ